MNVTMKRKSRLTAIYEALPASEKTLVQLCSIIYEPTSVTSIMKCLSKSGISLPATEGKTALSRSVDYYLSKLQEQKLLNSSYQVHPSILEIATRDAVSAGYVYKLGHDLKEMDSAASWRNVRASRRETCFSCRNQLSGAMLETPAGLLCPSCATREMEAVGKVEDISSWEDSKFKEALSPGGSLRSRLTVLWRMTEVMDLLSKSNRKLLDEVVAMLVENLRFAEPHPMAETVREAAVHACIAAGSKVLPLLLKIHNPQPPQFHAAVVWSAGTIAPASLEVQALLEKASQNPNPEVRLRVATALENHGSAWAKTTIQRLSKDKDHSVAREAKRVMDGWKSPLHRYVAQRTRIPLSAGHYGPMIRGVLDEAPLTESYYYSTRQCPRMMRDLRIGIYTGNTDLYNQRISQLYSHCRSGNYTSPHPLVRVCAGPFDAGWFETLPVQLQSSALTRIFEHTLKELATDEEALAYGNTDRFIETVHPSERFFYRYGLTCRLIAGGELGRARELIEQTEQVESSYSRGLRGILHLVEGESENALAAFERDLKEFRKRLRKRNAFFTGLTGPFYLLAMLNQNDASMLGRINQFLNSSEVSDSQDSLIKPLYGSLRAITLAQSLEVDAAHETLKGIGETGNAMATLLSSLAAYWTDGRLDRNRIDALSRVFIRAREAGLKWLAMESAELLCRAEEETPVRRNYITGVEEETGMKSFIRSIRIEEPWRRRLRLLTQSLSGGGEAEKKAAPKASRLVWLVRYEEPSTVFVQPMEQKMTAKGHWSSGRAVSLSRLHSGSKMDFMTDQDRKIRTALEKQWSGYYYAGADFTFASDKLLPALVGHPLLFLEGSPGVQVEFVKGEPEILVTRSGPNFEMKFSVEVTDERFHVVRETPTRFKVIEFTDNHRLIAKALGSEGLSVPAAAREEISSAIASVSSLVTVHSAIEGKSEDIEDVPGDPMPHFHLLPAGTGFRAEMFVKPFSESGPYLKAGVGVDNVIADVGGKRMLARRDLKREKEMAAAAEKACPSLSNYSEGEGLWFMADPEDCLQLLLELKDLQDKEQAVVEWPEGEKLRVTRELSFDRLRMQISSKADWFGVEGKLELDNGMVFDLKRLLEMLNDSPTRFIRIGEGEFLTLTRELRKRLEELDLYSEKRSKEIRLHPLAALAIQDLTDNVPDLEVDEAWKARLGKIKSAREYTPSVPSTLKAQLRDYQVEGYQWMSRLAFMGIGACLADDMGLGKTIQALAVILERAPQGPTLVVAPTSVCMNWVDEANRFAPTLNVTTFGAGNREEVVKGQKAFDMLVSSYGLMLQEAELLSSVEWNTIVLDEAQAIKNITAKRSQAAMELKGNFKIITTGTPIENHLGEFWTLFNFINPGLLGSYKRFSDRFALPIEKYGDQDAKKRLKKLIQPFILRRTKSQVLEELPPRTEVLLKVEMSPKEAAFYEALRLQALENVDKENDAPIGQKQIRILAEIMKLRQACCNPRLVMPDTDISSSKLELFGDIVSELIENRHKALVFSQFVGHLSLIRQFLDGKGIKYRYLDGSTPPKERKQEVDAFQAGDGDLFLISLKAGGLGLNLTAADYVIHMDPWWNPAVEDQASDRAHRIGQQHPVTVYRLVAKNTIEEKIVKLHQEKRDLAGSLLDGTDISGKISVDELVQLIREQ